MAKVHIFALPDLAPWEFATVCTPFLATSLFPISPVHVVIRPLRSSSMKSGIFLGA